MKFYTSYYAKLSDLPDNFMKVSISRFPPDYIKNTLRLDIVNGDMLAPSKELLSAFKNNEIDEQTYEKRYVIEVAENLSKKGYDSFQHYIEKVIYVYENEMETKYDAIVFLCFEKPGEFCHRRTWAKIMQQCGYNCPEYEFKKDKSNQEDKKTNSLF